MSVELTTCPICEGADSVKLFGTLGETDVHYGCIRCGIRGGRESTERNARFEWNTLCEKIKHGTVLLNALRGKFELVFSGRYQIRGGEELMIPVRPIPAPVLSKKEVQLELIYELRIIIARLLPTGGQQLGTRSRKLMPGSTPSLPRARQKGAGSDGTEL